MSNHLHYKVTIGSDLFGKLWQLHLKIEDARAQIKSFVESIGGTNFATSSGRDCVSCDAIEFDDKPDGWKNVGEKWQGLYMPLAKNKELRAQIEALPCISNDELNDILKFEWFIDSDLAVYHRPAVIFRNDTIVVGAPKKYLPIDGLEPITSEEYEEVAESKQIQEQIPA